MKKVRDLFMYLGTSLSRSLALFRSHVSVNHNWLVLALFERWPVILPLEKWKFNRSILEMKVMMMLMMLWSKVLVGDGRSDDKR